ncbi:MAG: hypothetical protein SCH71_02570 [Desulfobulbaceae bacterium]|nr:hypothetical protein [Desulfobulbaceae bacterium]
MKETKLTWFDRVMVGITFAEAGADEPVLHNVCNAEDRQHAQASTQEEQYEPGRNTIPVYS